MRISDWSSDVCSSDLIAIVANGTLVHRGLAAADALAAEGVAARVVNMASIAPLDTELLAEAAKTGAIVTAEEGLARGGLGGAVAEWCAENAPVRMRLLGFPGFLPTGSAAWLMDRFGLSRSEEHTSELPSLM